MLYTEIYDNIPGPGCNLNDWNTTYDSCNCCYEITSYDDNNEKHFLNNKDLIENNVDLNELKFSNLETKKSRINKNVNMENYNNIDTNYVNDKNTNTTKTINKICKIKKSITCNNSTCTCIILKHNYDENGLLNVRFNDLNWLENVYQINECNDECNCNEEDCSNRVVQNGPKFKLDLFDAGLKGKGVRALEPIKKGSFVIEYAGEIIGEKEAEDLFQNRSKNSESNYIMYLKEHFRHDNSSKSTIIDAKNYSNIARFINHSCDPNLFVLPVRINNIIPHAALFALKDILPMEELSYDYNAGSIDGPKVKLLRNKCYCDASNCKGYLPNNF